MKNTKINRYVVSVDVVVFGYRDRQLYIPLFLRNDRVPNEPSSECWSLTGAPIQPQESPEEACMRKLEEDIGLSIRYLEQLHTFADPNRDLRQRTFSIAYYALMEFKLKTLIGEENAKSAEWFPLNKLPKGPWAFDHRRILEMAVTRLKGKLLYEPVGFHLLPHEFSLADLLCLYETILGRNFDRRNFYKKVKASGLIQFIREVPSRRGYPTQIFKFD
ncbi:MAG TPA: NUDIX domain-containing protein [Verrucomicrobiales bacterium]|nr:NUDIX domain-containing protein [Verrucomicrobiales bacterium]